MLKGKTVIELTDVNTGQKEIYEETNMVTEAIADVLNTNIRGMLYDNTSFNGSNGEAWMLPIKKNIMGGILLYQNELEEREDNIYAPLTIKDIDLENRIINIDHQLQRTSKMEYIIESTKTNAGTRKIPMTEDVYLTFKRILENRPTDLPEKMVDGYIGFLFRDKNGMPEVAMHWEHRFNHAVKRYNDIFRVQMPNITPHVCRHTYCSNQARAGMNPKTLQYLMGHSEIGVTMNTYTHLGLDDAKDEMIRLEELEQARKEIDKTNGEKPMKQIMFKAI